MEANIRSDSVFAYFHEYVYTHEHNATRGGRVSGGAGRGRQDGAGQHGAAVRGEARRGGARQGGKKYDSTRGPSSPRIDARLRLRSLPKGL